MPGLYAIANLIGTESMWVGRETMGSPEGTGVEGEQDGVLGLLTVLNFSGAHGGV